jgi:hypothetical protein
MMVFWVIIVMRYDLHKSTRLLEEDPINMLTEPANI